MIRSNTINKPNDPTVQNPPSDTVQCLKWAPSQMSLLCGTSWNGSATIWEINQSGQNMLKAQTTSSEAILSGSWKNDLSSVFLGSCDNTVKAWDLATNTTRLIGNHNGPVREVLWCEQINHLISGSWDSSVSFWDCRSPTPTANIQLGARVFGMALRYPLLVGILSDKKHAVWNLQWLQQGKNSPDIMVDNNVKVQFKSVDCYSDASGFSIGLIEGRCAMKKINPSSYKAENDFTFKCHRDNGSQSAYAVNCISFNAAHGTFATGGSDSSLIYWDRFAKQCLKTFTGLDGPVTAMDFKQDGSLFAYATGYDWARGLDGMNSVPTKISYRVSSEDSKPKQSFK